MIFVWNLTKLHDSVTESCDETEFKSQSFSQQVFCVHSSQRHHCKNTSHRLMFFFEYQLEQYFVFCHDYPRSKIIFVFLLLLLLLMKCTLTIVCLHGMHTHICYTSLVTFTLCHLISSHLNHWRIVQTDNC